MASDSPNGLEGDGVGSGRVVKSGLELVNEEKFVWKLQNFEVMKHKASILYRQKLVFDILMEKGSPPASSSGWELFLLTNNVEIGREKVTAIDIVYQCSHYRSSAPLIVYTQLQLQVFDQNGAKVVDRKSDIAEECKIDHILGSGVRLGFLEDHHPSLSELPVQSDGSLVLNLTWRRWLLLQEGILVSAGPLKFDTTPKPENNPLQKKLIADFGKALEEEEDGKSGSSSDVKLVSSDGEEFKAHSAILGVRSPVFSAMFSTDMKESKMREVQIEDVSSAGIYYKFMLHYIYTGALLPFTYGADLGPETPTIQEVLYLAEKYQLKDLVDHFDQNLGHGDMECDTENWSTLLKLALKYNLKTALQSIRGEIWRSDILDQVFQTLCEFYSSCEEIGI